jgi:hypothetical protein
MPTSRQQRVLWQPDLKRCDVGPTIGGGGQEGFEFIKRRAAYRLRRYIDAHGVLAILTRIVGANPFRRAISVEANQ